jgi:hypothetical protein
MAIQTTFPAIKPTLLLDFAKVKQLDPRITFTRASTATFTNSVGVLSTAASGVPRFDFNPVTEESLGLLIEEQRTNLATNSEEVTGTINVAVTSNALAAPNGLATADLVLDNATNSEHYADKTVAVTSGVTHTYSAFIAPHAASQIPVVFLRVASNAGNAIVAYTFATGIISTSGSPVAFGSQAFPNGWIRIWVSVLATGSGTGVFRVQLAQSITTAPYIGTGQGCYVWGQQVEAGAFPTSYIQTVASQVTRAADSASMTGTNFSSWYNQGEGTMYAEYIYSSGIGANAQAMYSISDGGESNRLVAFRTTALNQQFDETGGGGSIVTGAALANTPYRSSLAYRVNDMAVSINGAATVADTSVTISAKTQLAIGNRATGERALNGTIRKIAYYPIRCTNAQLVALTS